MARSEAMSVIGLDLGGTKVFGVVLENGEIKNQAKRKTPAEGGPDAIVKTMAGVVDDLGGVKRVRAIGIGAPGLIDRKNGILKRAPNLKGWVDDYPLGPAVSDAVGGGLPVVLANDVEAGIVGEHRLGAARGCRHALAIWMGTGVGGGLIIDGQIHR